MRRLTGEEPAPVGGSEVTINTRYTLSPQNAQAAQYILEYLQAAGYEDVFYHEFRYSSTTTQNIVAVKLGATYPDEIVVYGAHMDSTSGSPTTSAPGCIDNGSGTGGTLAGRERRRARSRPNVCCGPAERLRFGNCSRDGDRARVRQRHHGPHYLLYALWRRGAGPHRLGGLCGGVL